MIVQEFRFLSWQDPKNDESNRTRKYEYEKVLRRAQSLKPKTIHNTSCGFKKTHAKFTRALEEGPWEVISSDITEKPGQLQWDVMTEPPFMSDLVLSISTLEHLKPRPEAPARAWDMLWKAVAPGGTLIYTFDIPQVPVEWLEDRVGEECVIVTNPIHGKHGQPQIVYLEILKEQ